MTIPLTQTGIDGLPVFRGVPRMEDLDVGSYPSGGGGPRPNAVWVCRDKRSLEGRRGQGRDPQPVVYGQRGVA